jgi:hypothetical protein
MSQSTIVPPYVPTMALVEFRLIAVIDVAKLFEEVIDDGDTKLY